MTPPKMGPRTKLRQLVAVTILSIFGWGTFWMTSRETEVSMSQHIALERQQKKPQVDAKVGGIIIKKLTEDKENDARTVSYTTIMRTVAYKPFDIKDPNNRSSSTIMTSPTPQQTKGVPVSKKQAVSKFQNVCIEFDNNMQPGQMPMPGHRRLVVYNASSEKEFNLQVGLFDLHVLPAEMPKGRQFIDQFFAYFIPLTNSVNATSNKHEFEQKLNTLIKQTPEYHPRGRHQVYLAVGERCPGDDKLWCLKHGKFYDTAHDDELSLILLRSSLHPNFIYFTQAPSGVCYATAFVAHSVHGLPAESGVRGAMGNAHPADLV